MIKTKPPCYECSERGPGCHGKCEKYQEWLAKYRQDRDAIKAAKDDPARKVLAGNTLKRKEKWRKQHQ